MAINFPSSLDAFTNPQPSDPTNSPDHADQHANANDAIEAIEAKIGVGAGTPSADKVLVGSGDGTSSWSGTVNSLTLGTPSISVGSDAEGDIFYRSNAGAVSRVQIGSSGQVLTSNGTTPVWNNLKTNLYQNVLINGSFSIWQRGSSISAASSPANNDDTYLADRWILLSDGNDIVDVELSADAPEGSESAVKCVVQTANKRFGFLQIIENKDAEKLAGQTVSLSFQAKTTSAKLIENLRAQVFAWDSTADAVTSDIVSAWGSEGSDITPVANWTAENAGSELALTTAYQRFEIENISLDTSGLKNIAVFIYTDDTDAAANDELFISQVQLNQGATASGYSPRSYNEELSLCSRFFWTLGGQAAYETICDGYAASATEFTCVVWYPNFMRSAPTISYSDLSHFSAAGQVPTGIVQASPGLTRGRLAFQGLTGLTTGDGGRAEANNTTSMKLSFSAEL